MEQFGRENSRTIETAGEVFTDGTAIDLIRDAEGLRLIRYRKGGSEVKKELSHAGHMYAPIQLDRRFSDCIRFPTRIAQPESTQQLFTAVYNLLAHYLGQLEVCTLAIVCGVFMSWYAWMLGVAPILWIFAPPGSPRNQTLQLLNLLCRRSVRLVGLRRSDLARIPMRIQPALLMDEPQLQPAMQAILQASVHRGSHIYSGPGFLELFGPKIIFSQEFPTGTALEPHIFRASLIPVSGNLPLLTEKAAHEIADDYQPRLLGHFLRNFDRVQVPKLDGSKLTLEVRDTVSALAAPLVGDEKLQAKILRLFAAQDEEVRADRACAFDSVVIESILSLIHQDGWSRVRTETLAEKVGAVYKGRGVDKDPSPESVGWAIKRLGIPSGRINKAGNGVELTVQVCRLVHQLAISYGVRTMELGFREGCRYCKEIELSTGAKKASPKGHAA